MKLNAIELSSLTYSGSTKRVRINVVPCTMLGSSSANEGEKQGASAVKTEMLQHATKRPHHRCTLFKSYSIAQSDAECDESAKMRLSCDVLKKQKLRRSDWTSSPLFTENVENESTPYVTSASLCMAKNLTNDTESTKSFIQRPWVLEQNAQQQRRCQSVHTLTSIPKCSSSSSKSINFFPVKTSNRLLQSPFYDGRHSPLIWSLSETNSVKETERVTLSATEEAMIPESLPSNSKLNYQSTVIQQKGSSTGYVKNIRPCCQLNLVQRQLHFNKCSMESTGSANSIGIVDAIGEQNTTEPTGSSLTRFMRRMSRVIPSLTIESIPADICADNLVVS